MPLEASHMDDALRDAFIALRVAPEQSRKHSWHSYRIRLACKLRAAKKDDHTIQACVRWRCKYIGKIFYVFGSDCRILFRPRPFRTIEGVGGSQHSAAII